MAKGRGRPPGRGTADRAGASGSAGKVLLGVILGAAAVAAGGYLYLHTAPGAESMSRRETAAVSGGDTAKREPAAGVPAGKTPATRTGTSAADRVAGDRQPPFGASEEVFEAAATIYAQRCASCHGTLRHDAAGAHGQRAAQLFRGGRERAAAETPEQVFAAINLGAQGLGMPAYHGILTDGEIWQVVLLLRSAAEPLPDPVVAVLEGAR